MRAAILKAPHSGPGPYLALEGVPLPAIRPGYSVLKVIACGVGRTDLHIVTSKLPPLRPALIPGHQIVGEIADGATPTLPLVHASASRGWAARMALAGTVCTAMKISVMHRRSPDIQAMEVAEYVLVRTDFLFRLPIGLDNADAAPLLCEGIIGFSSLRVAGVQPGERAGLYGLGVQPVLPSA